MKNAELILRLEETVEVVSPTLFKLFENKNLGGSFPVLQTRPELFLRHEPHGIYFSIKNNALTENITDTTLVCEEDKYPFEVFLSFNMVEIRHLHSFFGTIINSNIDYI